MSGCTECGKKLHPHNKTGLCRYHHGQIRNRDPEYRATIVASRKRKLAQDPEAMARQRAIFEQNRNAPGAREKRLANLVDSRPRALAAARAVNVAGSEGRVNAGRRRTATVLAWCPPQLRDDYRALNRMTGVSAADARRMIEEQNEMELARWRRSIGVAVEPERLANTEPVVSAKPRPQDEAFALAARVFDVTEDEILGPSRARRIMLARYALAVGFSRAGYSTTGIADALNRTDHTTAINLLSRAQEHAARDRKFARQVERVARCWPVLEAAA